MGYRIEYDSGKKQYEVRRKDPLRFPAMVAGALVLFVLLTMVFWDAGAAAIRDALIPGDDVVTLQALESLASDLRSGASVQEAVTAFCREIVDGAANSH